MKARLDIVDIKDNPFEEDVLHRYQYARVLTDVLSTYSDGAVIAINGSWGSGKTTFIKKWQKMLDNKGFSTVYFNAWESDYLDDPLVPLIANLKKYESIDENSTSKFENVVKAGSKLAVAGAIGMGKGLIEMIGSSILKSGIDAIADEAKNLFKNQIDEFTSRTKSMEEFKNELQDYVAKINSDKALVYFIDELDRCCPTYAVKVLERIKHLFEIPEIIFVLSIDKNQLSKSIKGYFGGEIDSEEYLRRFFDINYNLPQPDVADFCKYLFDYYDFKVFFNNNNRLATFSHYGSESEMFIKSAVFISNSKQLTLRQIDRVFSLTRLSLCSFKYNHYLFPDLFYFLTYIKVCHQELFDKIQSKSLLVQDLVNEIEKIVKDIIISDGHSSERSISDFVFTIARMIVVYSVNEYSSNKNLIIKSPNKELAFKTTVIPSDKLIEDIEFCDDHLRGGDCPLCHFTNKISLIDGFVDNDELS